MGYNSTTKIMTAPVSIGDIQAAVSGNSLDLGDLVKNGTVNKWAKFKPERNDKFILALTDRVDNHFGLKIDVFTSGADLVAGYSQQWQYLRPRGVGSGQTERFRALDFTNPSDTSATGYNGKAKCFVNQASSIFPPSYTTGQGTGGALFQVQFNSGNNLPAGSIAMSDIYPNPLDTTYTIADMYFGLVFTDGTNYYIITSSSAVSANAYMAEITVPEANNALASLTNGQTYDVYPVFSKVAHTTMTQIQNTDKLVAFPLSSSPSPSRFTPNNSASVQSLGVQILSANYVSARQHVQFKVTASEAINDVYYRIFTASSASDTTGTQMTEGGPLTGLSNQAPQTVQVQLNTSRPDYVRVYVYRGLDNTVNAQAWAATTMGEPDMPLVE